MLAAPSGVNPRHSRIAIGILAVLFVAFLCAGYAIYLYLAKGEEEQVERTLNHIADIQTAALSAWTVERLGDARVFSSGRFLGETIHTWLARGAPDDTTKEQVWDQLEAIRKTYNYLEVSILDAEGNIRISTRENQMLLDPIAVQTVRNAMVTNTIQVSSIHPANDFLQAGRMVNIATPLLDVLNRNEKMSSVLLLRADVNGHLGAFSQSKQPGTATTEVLLTEVQQGRIVITAKSSGAKHFSERDVLPMAPEEFIAALKGGRHILLETPAGRTVLAVAHKISMVDWYLITLTDRDAIGADVRRLAWTVTGSAAALLLLVGMTVFLWWRGRESQFRFQVLQASTEKALLQRQYDYLSKYASDMIILADAKEHIIDVNDTAAQLLGQERTALIGRPLQTLFRSSCQPALEAARTRLQQSGMAMFEATLQHEVRIPMSVEVSARVIDMEEKRFIQLICRDITERRRSEAALRESQDRLNGILASILDIVWSFSADLTRIIYMNESVERIYGHPVSTFLEHPHRWFDAIHPDDRKRIKTAMAELSGHRSMCDSEYRVIHRDGSVRWVHCRCKLVADAEGKPLRIDGVSTDVTQRKSAEQQVQKLAYYDSVTHLPNRTLLHDRLAQAMHMAMRSQRKVALLFMDLDNFKNVNDSLGHHIGDMLLRAIGERLGQSVRSEDTIARIGGDEFLVVLPDIEKGVQAVAVAEKILAATAVPFKLQEHQIHTTISIGISVYPDDAQELHELIRHADTALYQAKSHGRDNYQFFTEELNTQIVRNSTIERELRQAINDGDLSLWYQPQIDTRSGKLVGAEALLRWRRDNRDFRCPDEFIPVAEERGLITRIGEWSIREVCTQCRRWQLQGLSIVPVAVNISPIQFQQKGFADLVTGILAECRLDASYLELEITESAIMRRAALVAELATHLRQAGVGISIDDFGTGYSSLSFLKQIPIDKIKIDRSFVADMLFDDDDDAITFAIINLAHSLNLRVIAEGVESREQIDRLRTFGCDEVQGFFYSRAVPADTFAGFLTSGEKFPEAAAVK